MTTVAYRRARHVVCYWRGDDFVVCDYVNRVEVVVEPALFDILHVLRRWQSIADLARRFPDVPATLLRTAARRLTAARLLVRSTRPRSAAKRALDDWGGWLPEAGFFHFSTKDVRYVTETHDGSERQPGPSPSPLKVDTGRRLPLRVPSTHGDLQPLLEQRRTWRRFGRAPIAVDDLATLLGLTFGVQHWAHVPGSRRVALKTSPSGGSRHSIEAYVLALKVDGLARGLYHFLPDEHALVRVKRGADARQVARYLPTQPGYRNAAALVVMTSVFARARARYPYARAYRSLFAEAGHLCQTFALVATSLGLAPFQTMAFADSIIERDLGVDGISESALYVAGVGSRPPGTDWAPRADRTAPVPRRSAPTWRRRA